MTGRPHTMRSGEGTDAKLKRRLRSNSLVDVRNYYADDRIPTVRFEVIEVLSGNATRPASYRVSTHGDGGSTAAVGDRRTYLSQVPLFMSPSRSPDKLFRQSQEESMAATTTKHRN